MRGLGRVQHAIELPLRLSQLTLVFLQFPFEPPLFVLEVEVRTPQLAVARAKLEVGQVLDQRLALRVRLIFQAARRPPRVHAAGLGDLAGREKGVLKQHRAVLHARTGQETRPGAQRGSVGLKSALG